MSNLQELLIPGIMKYMTTVIIGFIGIHIGFLVLFLVERLPGMIVMEVLSVISYILLLRKLHFKITKYDTDILSGFITFVLVEVNLYMVLADMMMGGACRFDNYVYGLLLITAFQFYVSHNLKRDILLKLMIMCSYFGVRIYNHLCPPLYTDYSSWIVTFFSYVNPIIVTGAIILFVFAVPILIFHYEAALTKKASIDRLTGLLNRNYLDKMMLEELPFNLAMIDIDDFKRINDTYGHDNGDLVLKHLGTLLKKCEEEYKNISAIRWGGEEFVITYEIQDNNKYVFLDILEHLRKEIENSQVQLNDKETIQYRVTIGAVFAHEAVDCTELLKIADNRLYQGKQSGKNVVVFKDQ